MKWKILRFPTRRTPQALLTTVISGVIWPWHHLVKGTDEHSGRTFWEMPRDLFYPVLLLKGMTAQFKMSWLVGTVFVGVNYSYAAQLEATDTFQVVPYRGPPILSFHYYESRPAGTGSPVKPRSHGFSLWGCVTGCYFEKHPSGTTVMLPGSSSLRELERWWCLTNRRGGGTPLCLEHHFTFHITLMIGIYLFTVSH